MYQNNWGGTQPGCLIVLRDQSDSMNDPFGGTQVGDRQKKSEAVALVINSFLDALVKTNTLVHNDGSTSVRPRADIAVIGYGGQTVASVFGGDLEGRDFVSFADLQAQHPTVVGRSARTGPATFVDACRTPPSQPARR